jgi:dienelactone hydrolase
MSIAQEAAGSLQAYPDQRIRVPAAAGSSLSVSLMSACRIVVVVTDSFGLSQSVRSMSNSLASKGPFAVLSGK